MKMKVTPCVKPSERCGSPHAGSSTCLGCDPDYWIPTPEEKLTQLEQENTRLKEALNKLAMLTEKASSEFKSILQEVT